jgi:hypothetical protein
MSVLGDGSGYLPDYGNGNWGGSYYWGRAPTMAQALQSMGDAFSNAGWPSASAALHGLADSATPSAGFSNSSQPPQLWQTIGVQPAMPTQPAVNTQTTGQGSLTMTRA